MQGKQSYPLAVLVAFDQLGNALTGGHPQATISERVGCLAKKARVGRLYWQFLERVINYTFYPIDGPEHCYRSWRIGIAVKHQRGNTAMQVLLSIFIIVTCIPIALILRLAVLVMPQWEFRRAQQLSQNTDLRRARAARGRLIAALSGTAHRRLEYQNKITNP